MISHRQIQVQSFTSSEDVYDVQVEGERVVSCTCPDFDSAKVVCKHMFLASRTENLDISFSSALSIVLRSSSPLRPSQPNMERLRLDRIGILDEIDSELQTVSNNLKRNRTVTENQDQDDEMPQQKAYQSENSELSKILALFQSARRQLANLSQPLYATQ
jgi:SWIM zinc finger